MIYFLFFVLAFFIALILGFFIKKLALKLEIVDKPNLERKIHKKPTPLLGGLAIFLSFWVLILLAYSLNLLPDRYVEVNFLIGIFIGGIILMIGGFLDDKYSLSPKQQIIFPALSSLAVIFSGIGIEYVGNPFGEGLLYLNSLTYSFGGFGSFVLLADIFTVIWILGMIYTTKFLDGLDGLVSGISVIGSFIIFALSLTDKTFQPDVALLAIILAGAGVGFLIWNFHPAKIFLGEGGSVWLGFMLGVLAIISGGKIATALLIFGIPILDVAWIIIRRVFIEKKSPAIGDNKHLHFRLLEANLTQRKTVFILWGMSFLFGALSLFFQTKGKVYLLLLLMVVMIILGIWTTRRSKLKSSSPYSF